MREELHAKEWHKWWRKGRKELGNIIIHAPLYIVYKIHHISYDLEFCSFSLLSNPIRLLSFSHKSNTFPKDTSFRADPTTPIMNVLFPLVLNPILCRFRFDLSSNLRGNNAFIHPKSESTSALLYLYACRTSSFPCETSYWNKSIDYFPTVERPAGTCLCLAKSSLLFFFLSLPFYCKSAQQKWTHLFPNLCWQGRSSRCI
jgi:hypothetical protein